MRNYRSGRRLSTSLKNFRTKDEFVDDLNFYRFICIQSDLSGDINDDGDAGGLLDDLEDFIDWVCGCMKILVQIISCFDLFVNLTTY